MEKLLKIGEIAAFFNVSVRAMRLYEKKGIIIPAKIDAETGYRYYSINQVHQINSLLELKALGFSLSEIKSLLSGNIDQKKLVSVLLRKKQAWQDTISSAKNKVESIEEMITRIEKSKKAGTIDKISDEERAWLLVKLVCVEDLRSQRVLSEAIWL